MYSSFNSGRWITPERKNKSDIPAQKEQSAKVTFFYQLSLREKCRFVQWSAFFNNWWSKRSAVLSITIHLHCQSYKEKFYPSVFYDKKAYRHPH